MFFSSFRVAEHTVSFVAYPVLIVKDSIMYPLKKAASYMNSVDDLQSKVNFLQQKQSELQARFVEFESLKIFHEQTHEMLSFVKRYDADKKIIAKVLLKHISDRQDYILISVGTDYGITKDNVVVYKNMLIGRVIEVYPWYSKVALTTDKRCKISAQIKKGVEGICCGQNHGKLELNFVPHFKKVKEQELITSTGQGLVYPQGFGLGTVDSVYSDNVTHYIQVKPMLDIDQLEYVYVLQK